MNSSQDHDGPSGQGHGPEPEQSNNASTSTPARTHVLISTTSPAEPTSTSTPASVPAPALAAADATSNATTTATATAAATASEAPTQRGEKSPVQEFPSAKTPDVGFSINTSGEPTNPSSAKEPVAYPDGMSPPALLTDQYPQPMVDGVALQHALFDTNANRTGLATPYFVDADPNTYDPNGDNSPAAILEGMRTGFPPPYPISLSHTQLLDLSGFDHPSLGPPWPSYGQHEVLEESDQEEAGPSPNLCYGKLILPDTEHWITSRTVLIGRDVKLYKHIKAEHDYEQRLQESLNNGRAPPDPPPRSLRKYKSSYISQEGGALGPGSDDEEVRPAKRRKTAVARQPPEQQQDGANASSNVISSRQYFEQSRPVNVDDLRPSDEVVVRLNIHGAGPDYTTMYQHTKGISREHLKIQLNPVKNVWEAVVLGRNGVFLRDHTQAEDFVHHKMNEVITLKSGDIFQIQKVEITFSLNRVDNGKTGAELESTYSENGKEMSFDFQSSRGDEMRDTDDSSIASLEIESNEMLAEGVGIDSDDSDDSDEEMADAPSLDKSETRDQNGGNAEEIRETVESDPPDDIMKLELSPGEADALAQLPLPPKKRGPGRPPKNGIMSKREERLLKKQAQEEAKKNMPPQEPGEQPQKRKVGRPRKHPLPEDAEGQSEKRKYKPRRSKGEEGDDDADGEKPAKEKSQKHKTPPLELKREDFTEEQLQKPTKNYQMLIDEIMTAAPPKGYSLKQVYKRIQERWPFFYFCVDTKGWESSVRHNLLGSECFKKIDGNWHRVPGVPLESGKKRKPSDATADPRVGGIYNGYSHPYHPPPHAQPHGHQPMVISTGLSQPNLPPRYPPNGQAYQILQGPPPNPAQPTGAAPNHQGLPRPGFPQQQTLPPGAQTNGYAAAGAPPRPHFQGNQPPPFNPIYGNRPQPPHVAPTTVPGPTAGQTPAQRPPVVRPGPGAPGMPTHGMQTGVNSSTVPRPVAAPSSQQSVATSAPPAPLGPVIEPTLKTFIRDFRAEVVKQLHAKEGKRSEAVAMSVINRGLGLTDRSLVPELEAYEKLILTVFHQHKKLYPKVRADAAARSSSASSAVRSAGQAPVAGGNGSATPGPSRAGVPATGSNVATPSIASGTTPPVPSGSSNVNGQSNKSMGSTAGPVPSGSANGSATPSAVRAAPGTAISAAPKAAPTNLTPKPSTTTGPGSSTPSSAGPTTSTPAAAGPAPSPSVAAGPNPGSSTNTGPPVPRPVPVGTAPNTSANTTLTNPKQAASAPIPNVSTASGAAASSKPNASGPAGAAPGTPILVPSASAVAISASPQPAGVSPAPSATPVSAATNGGAPKPTTPTGAPAISTSAPSGLRAALAAPATPATPDGSKDIELLDPKLVTVILTFKKAILPTLADKLDLILGESLIMSAVDRMLGFMDDTFIHVKTEQQQKNLAEAEKALMKHLETRFHEYMRTRSTSR